MMKKILFLLVISLLVLAGCSQSEATKTAQSPAAAPQGAPQSASTAGWAVSDPVSQGMDPQILEQMQAEIKKKKLPLHSLLIIRNGQIVSETYYAGNRPETKHVLFSVTKSFVSTLIGIAHDQGKLESVNQNVMEFFPNKKFANPDSRKLEMDVEDLLTMTSGLGWTEGDSSYGAMYRSSDWSKWVMDLPMIDDPGESFTYCSGCTHVLSVILQEATGTNPQEFAEENLFKPLGITNYDWETDADGTPIGGWGLYLTSRDMAKLGYLYLHNGKWGDTQVVSSEWVRAATSAYVQTGGRLGYGYQWWIYDTHDAYVALGRDGQTIFVAPDLDLIVVTTAHMPGSHDPIFALIDNYILPSISE